MALTPGTLPENTVYPATVQTLLETFAAYLTSPTSPTTIFVQAAAPVGIPEGTGWFNPFATDAAGAPTPTFQIYARTNPTSSGSAPVLAWQSVGLADLSVTTASIADGAVTTAKLETSVQGLLASIPALSTSGVARLEEGGGGSQQASFFVMADGTLRSTGYDGATGKNGFGTKATGNNVSFPKRCGFSPPLGTSKVAKVYTTYQSTFALTDDGRVFATGAAYVSQLGLGNTNTQVVFQEILAPNFGSSPVTKLAMTGAGGNRLSVYALTQAGNVYSWGYNTHGQLGLGTVGTPNLNTYPTPQLVTGLIGLARGDGAATPNPVTDIVVVGSGVANTAATVAASAYALMADGNVYACGYNVHGQIGGGNVTDRSYFALITGITNFALTTPLTIAQVVGAYGVYMNPGVSNTFYTSVAFRLSDGTLRTLGTGNEGQMGNLGTTTINSTPQNVYSASGVLLGATGAKVVNLWGFAKAFYALMDDGTLYGWGYNGDGGLGLGDTTQRNQATAMPLTNVAYVSLGGNHNNISCVVAKTDGTLWAAGNNSNGQLGLGVTSATTPTFTQVLIDTLGVAKVVFTANWDTATNGRCSMIIRLNNGQVLSCGFDANGQLGLDAPPSSVSVPSFINF